MIEKTRAKGILANVRLGYILICVIYFAAFTFVPFRVFYGSTWADLIYMVIPVAGMVLLLADLVIRRNLFSLQRVLLLILFFCAYLASIVVNRQYDFMGNLKLMIWMGIQVFLLCAPDDEVPLATHLRHLCIIGDTFIAIWLVGALISFGQYCIQYGGYVENIADGKLRYSRQGFIENRLFGVFTDPNYAAVCSLVAIGLAALILYVRKNGRLLKTYYIVSIVFQVFYLVLSGSRTALLGGIIALAFTAALYVWGYCAKKKTAVRVMAALLAAVLSAGVIYGGDKVLQDGLAYVPAAIASTHLVDDLEIPEEPVDLNREDVVDTTNISNNRFKIWDNYFRALRRSPIVGMSPRKPLDFVKRNFPRMYVVQKQYLVHNGYLAVLVGTGILGAIPIMLWFLLAAIELVRYLFKHRTDHDEHYWPTVILTAMCISLLVSAFFMMEIFFSMDIDTFLFWPLFGYLLCFLRQAARNGEPRKPLLKRAAKTN